MDESLLWMILLCIPGGKLGRTLIETRIRVTFLANMIDASAEVLEQSPEHQVPGDDRSHPTASPSLCLHATLCPLHEPTYSCDLRVDPAKTLLSWRHFLISRPKAGLGAGALSPSLGRPFADVPRRFSIPPWQGYPARALSLHTVTNSQNTATLVFVCCCLFSYIFSRLPPFVLPFHSTHPTDPTSKRDTVHHDRRLLKLGPSQPRH
jgi:hypothetical protein